MEQIKKYDSYSSDLKSGDIVIFDNNERKIIKTIKSGHRVLFTDGDEIDLWVSEDNIQGVIQMDCEQSKLIVEPIIFESKSSNENAKEKTNSLATSYKELHKLLYHGGDSVEFYHITAVENAAEIFSGDYFYSRDSGCGHIKYDNIELNETTNSVMSSNYSWQIEKYARFYLNIKNKTAYAMQKNYKQHNTFGVIIAVPFQAIWKSKTKVILSPINAHNLAGLYFNWSTYNIGFENNLKNLAADDFNFKRTFEMCNFDEDNPYLAAEILFYDKISLNNVGHIYFKTSENKNAFLSKLPSGKRILFENLCVVCRELFW